MLDRSRIVGSTAIDYVRVSYHECGSLGGHWGERVSIDRIEVYEHKNSRATHVDRCPHWNTNAHEVARCRSIMSQRHHALTCIYSPQLSLPHPNQYNTNLDTNILRSYNTKTLIGVSTIETLGYSVPIWALGSLNYMLVMLQHMSQEQQRCFTAMKQT